MSDSDSPVDAETLLAFADRIDTLPPEAAEWVGTLFQECLRARMHEAELLSGGDNDASPAGNAACRDDTELAQVALDVAEWLRTLWHVGYMGAGGFPVAPCTTFPVVELEDVLQSSLFARIRQGKRPLPFPPPTRHGRPWHYLIEGDTGTHAVAAEIVRDGDGQPIAAIIEGDNGWQIPEQEGDPSFFVIQHRQRGPLFRLELGPGSALLNRLPPQLTQTIRLQERGGIRSFTLEWRPEDNAPQNIALRAATWERAESEAAYWIANNHPQLYGRIRLIRIDTAPE